MRGLGLVVPMMLAVAVRAPAAELVVRVDDGRGNPAADAVVTLRADGVPVPVQASAPETRIVDQRHETFVPYVEIFRPGDRVVFRNSDRTRHHVYSFAAAKSFEFVIAPGESSPPVTLDRAGEIAVGCNIHDHMIAHLYVSDAPWVARAGADGSVVFENLPAGTYTIEAWHPQLRPGRSAPRQTLSVDDAPVSAAFSLSLLPDPRQTADRSRY